MIMGAVAMRREPKGLAIAGFVIGLFGVLTGCIILMLYLAFVGALGLGIGFAVLSAVYAQVDDGIDALDTAAAEIVEWQETHGGVLPDRQQAIAAFQAAGIDATYQLVNANEFNLTLVIDSDSDDPWTFTGTFESDGDRQGLIWESEDGSSHGEWNSW